MKARTKMFEYAQKMTLPNGKQIVFRHGYRKSTILVYENRKLVKVRCRIHY